MAKPTLIRPNGDAAGMSVAQKECVTLLERILEDAKKGQVTACVVVACGPSDFGAAMAGTDAPRMLLGLEVAKINIMDIVTGKRTVLHR